MEKIGYKNLIAFQKANELAKEVYRLTSSFPREELYGLTSQIKRSAISIPANIAEGYRRETKKEKIRFYNIAQGSLVETEYYLGFSVEIGYIEGEQAKKLLETKEELAKVLYGLVRKTREDLLTPTSSLKAVR